MRKSMVATKEKQISLDAAFDAPEAQWEMAAITTAERLLAIIPQGQWIALRSMLESSIRTWRKRWEN